MKKYTYQVIEDNGGGLHLFVWEQGMIIYGATDYEYRPGALVKDLGVLDEGTEISEWDSNMDDPQEKYNSIISYQYGWWEIVAEGANGRRQLHKAKMGRAAQAEFGVSDDEKDEALYGG